MKNINFISTVIVVSALCCIARHAAAQSNTFLPIYRVTRAGATAAQATNLANYLNIPLSMLAQSNGLVSFIDPTNYVAVPTIPVTDPDVISNLLAATKNPYPAIPISFNAIDFTALSNLVVLNTNAALSSASNAFTFSGLDPQFGTPVAGHSTFTAFYTNTSGTIISNSQYLDTEVGYQFSLTNGYPLVGPGARVQVTYGGTGNVTRLLYAARQLTAGPSVQIISASEASNRVARLLPANARINLQLVYWSPPFQPWFSPPSAWNPTNIIPWYAYNGTIDFTNPVTGVVSPIHSRVERIPATDDTNFVPSINLAVFAPGSTQVVASVSVTGGTPPYTYLWAGSDTTASTNTGASISYTPVVRVAPPPLGITLLASSASVSVS